MQVSRQSQQQGRSCRVNWAHQFLRQGIFMPTIILDSHCSKIFIVYCFRQDLLSCPNSPGSAAACTPLYKQAGKLSSLNSNVHKPARTAQFSTVKQESAMWPASLTPTVSFRSSHHTHTTHRCRFNYMS